jgi:hypothetical protein
VTSNDNTTPEDDDDYLSEEELSEMLGSASHFGTIIERRLVVTWLNKNAADFLFEPGLDPKLQEYGTTVLEMVADAIREQEHWTGAHNTRETIQ